MILANLYNKVLGFFRQTETAEQTESAKETACNRLRVVLMQDRTNLTPELMERMRKELVELLSKYVEMDKDALELNLEQDGDQVALMLSIPVIRAKDEEEIKAALKTEDSESEEKENEEKEAEEKNNENNDENENSEKSNDDSKKIEDEKEDSEEIIEEKSSEQKEDENK